MSYSQSCSPYFEAFNSSGKSIAPNACIKALSCSTEVWINGHSVLVAVKWYCF
ncbi:predicted protein [Sclerotinia sclerotiorum 1980 UF-70]|uniref:Uncharacterized protein n=1 Tax=Sclerotinia sclerotiorum (strain ATCC 18683 / 1980 / Ss-1) TaxID=665079 RepID=A7EJE8_SCLS1|nr:predicted protein [Sclerotinia sclerotiorum 1980 UF-70]EDO02964.1 predicted protein [Sclerotinia sclerotiorum 1980 UF-70]